MSHTLRLTQRLQCPSLQSFRLKAACISQCRSLPPFSQSIWNNFFSHLIIWLMGISHCSRRIRMAYFFLNHNKYRLLLFWAWYRFYSFVFNSVLPAKFGAMHQLKYNMQPDCSYQFSTAYLVEQFNREVIHRFTAVKYYITFWNS